MSKYDYHSFQNWFAHRTMCSQCRYLHLIPEHSSQMCETGRKMLLDFEEQVKIAEVERMLGNRK